MIGILTEKPSASRNFARALGGVSGTYNGEQFIITAARGHLYEFAQPHELVPDGLAKKYKSWDLSNLPWDEKAFSWRRVMKEGASSTVAAIKKDLSQCDEIVIATDVDPTGEGELLAWEILDELKLRPKKWSRMYFTDEAPASIQKAFVSRKPLVSMEQDPDYVKADYRCKFDYLTMQFTRVASKNGDGRTVLRQGRLKSAMVLIVGDQLEKIAAYKKIPYYQNRFKDDHGVVYTDPDEPSYPDKSQVPGGLHSSPVVKDGAQMKKTAPPKLLDLAALSARLSSKGFKAQKVLDTYQRMYEAQVVSYPRTEDKVITPEQFNELLPLVDKIARVVGVDPAILTHRQPRPTHVKTGGAHGANRPGTNVPSVLGALDQYDAAGAKGLAQEIYSILARNYLATLAEDYEYEAQTGHVQDYPSYKGSVSVPKFAGWKAVFDDDADADGDDGGVANGLGGMADPYIYEGFPPKPQAPTMKWLMGQLEKRDVGTGATRTSIYAEVTSDKFGDKQLLSETKGKLSMARAGEMSYKLLPNTHIGDLQLTEQLQADMRAIASGSADPDDLLARMQGMVRDDMAAMAVNSPAMKAALNITAASYAEGTWNGQEIRFRASFADHEFTSDEQAALLAGQEVKLFGVTGKSGSKFNVKGKLANQDYNGKKFVGFEVTGYLNDDGTDRDPNAGYISGIWDGRQVKFKASWSGHEFTDAEAAELLAGREIVLMGVVGKSGKPFNVKGRLEEQDYKGKKFVGFKSTGFLNDDGTESSGGGGSGGADYCEGTWKGKKIRFKRVWSGYRFTDDECAALLAGGEISFPAKTKAGNDYTAVGKLAKQSFNGKDYIGFKLRDRNK